jgi:elongation factor Ts
MEITAAMVRDLRERTGAGLMECKRALEASRGDLEGAVDHLRKSGLKTAEKKASREMGEGRVHAWIGPKARVGALVAMTCETDFVANTEDFTGLLKEICSQVAEKNPASTEALLDFKHSKTGAKLGESIQLFIGKLGENTQVARFQRFENMKGRVGCYVHHDGKKAALVSVTTEAPEETAQAALKDLCMHIVFANPTASSRAEIPADRIERERAIYLEEVKGKPKEMQDKIVASKLDKFYSDNILSEQKWFKDESTTVQKVADATFGKGAKIEAFVRYQIGK